MSRRNGGSERRKSTCPAEKLFELHDIWVAAAMATRLPTPVNHERAATRIAAASWAAPLVGVVVGAGAAATYALALTLGLRPDLAAWVAVGVHLMLTGALHEDGLADSADGLGAGGDRDRIKTIMRDSRVGAFGAAALIIALAMKSGAIAALADRLEVLLALVAAGAASRSLMTVFWRLASSTTGEDGLAARAGRPRWPHVIAALVIGGGIAVACAGDLALLYGVLGAIATGGALVWYARRRLGAVSGDILGATQVIAELAILVALASA